MNLGSVGVMIIYGASGKLQTSCYPYYHPYRATDIYCPLECDSKIKLRRGWFHEKYFNWFYETSATRKEWFPCACCPPNYARYLF